MISKKQISFLLALMMLVSNAGLAFNIHYCGGQISAITTISNKAEACEMVVKAEKPCCAREIAKKHQKCCSDKELSLKGKTGDVIVKALSADQALPVLFTAENPSAIAQLTACDKCDASTYYCDAHAPPLFKLYCRYIYYA